MILFHELITQSFALEIEKRAIPKSENSEAASCRLAVPADLPGTGRRTESPGSPATPHPLLQGGFLLAPHPWGTWNGGWVGVRAGGRSGFQERVGVKARALLTRLLLLLGVCLSPSCAQSPPVPRTSSFVQWVSLHHWCSLCVEHQFLVLGSYSSSSHCWNATPSEKTALTTLSKSPSLCLLLWQQLLPSRLTLFISCRHPHGHRLRLCHAPLSPRT